jgi:hypothetical protein
LFCISIVNAKKLVKEYSSEGLLHTNDSMTLVSIVSEEAQKLMLFCYRLIILPSSQPEMSIISYLSLSLSPLGVAHVGTAAYTSCLRIE